MATVVAEAGTLDLLRTFLLHVAAGRASMRVVTRLQGDVNGSGPWHCRDLSGCHCPRIWERMYLVKANVSKAGFSRYC